MLTTAACTQWFKQVMMRKFNKKYEILKFTNSVSGFALFLVFVNKSKFDCQFTYTQKRLQIPKKQPVLLAESFNVWWERKVIDA